VIVVAAFSTDGRAREYSPWDGAPDYARFLIEELMPRVNGKFRTLKGPANTAAMGSSMGGLLSFYLCWKNPESFGLCGCVSTHFPYNQLVMEEFAPGSSKQRALPPGPEDWPLIGREIANGAKMPKGVRLYFDYGTEGLDAMYEPVQKRVDEWLVGQGFKEGTDFVSRKVQGATHNEAAWRARMDDPLAFLFGKRRP
jgi:S-formylglutathione hydrolase FrmB